MNTPWLFVIGVRGSTTPVGTNEVGHQFLSHSLMGCSEGPVQVLKLRRAVRSDPQMGWRLGNRSGGWEAKTSNKDRVRTEYVHKGACSFTFSGSAWKLRHFEIKLDLKYKSIILGHVELTPQLLLLPIFEGANKQCETKELLTYLLTATCLSIAPKWKEFKRIHTKTSGNGLTHNLHVAISTEKPDTFFMIWYPLISYINDNHGTDKLSSIQPQIWIS